MSSTARMAGIITGTKMRQIVLTVLAPATRDASSNEEFIFLKAGVKSITITLMLCATR